MTPSIDVSAIRILPQYGAVTAPSFSDFRGLVHPAGKQLSSKPSPSFLTTHPLDSYLATAPQEVECATHLLEPHQLVAAWGDHFRPLKKSGSGHKNILWLQTNPSLGFARMTFEENDLSIRLDVSPREVKTTRYTISTDTKDLHAFIEASLAHYIAVHDGLMDGLPDFATATGDDLMLAASLIYHQQFCLRDQKIKGQFLFEKFAEASPLPKTVEEGEGNFGSEKVFVRPRKPSTKNDKNSVEIIRFKTGEVIITIYNTEDFGQSNMPLFGNVLSLAAREMLPGLKAQPFVDFLAVMAP